MREVPEGARVTLSLHAVEQYVSRHRPELTLPQATIELRELVKTARYEGPAPRGKLFRCRGGVSVVVITDSRGSTVVTVLPAGGVEVDLPTEIPPEPAPTGAEWLHDVHAYLRKRANEGCRRAARLLDIPAELRR